MTTLILSVSIAVLLSFTCSLMEAALYSIPWSAIEILQKENPKKGKILFNMRTHVEKPIAAILTINTIANTAGATIAGGAFLNIFGEVYMSIFAFVFTIIILAIGEIIPKNIGVAYSKSIVPFMVYPLHISIKLLSPIIIILERLTTLVNKNSPKIPQISEDDICAAAGLSRKAGQIKEYEENCVRNILNLDEKHVHEAMTPRTVVFSLPSTITIDETYNDQRIWEFSRIPVYEKDRENLIGLVERRTIAQHVKDGKHKQPITSIMRPINFVQESLTLDVVLNRMLASHVHLFAVLDEYGGLSGVISLEDILEEMLGSEIIDESDKVADLRQLARSKFKTVNKPAQKNFHDAKQSVAQQKDSA